MAPAQSPAEPSARHRGRVMRWWLDRSVRRSADLIAARDEAVRAVQVKNDPSLSLEPADDLSAPDSESTEPLPTRRAARPGANLWVLYIEDNQANVEVVARYLSNRMHAHLASYPGGREGYEYAAAYRPDIILLDLPPEDLHGEQTLSRLKADPVTADIPVVVLCADASPGMTGCLFTAGALACLTKPLDLNEFGAILDSLPAPASASRHLGRK
jgi:CheY-like chemotaxis protein